VSKESAELEDVIAGNAVMETLDHAQYQQKELISRFRQGSELD